MTNEMIVDLATGETIHRELTAEDIEALRGTLDDQKAARLAAVASEYGVRIAVGYPVTLEGVEETLQCRNNEDRTNWLALLDACREAVADGHGAVPIQPPLRCTSNREYALTCADTIPLLKGVRAWAGDLLKNRWTLSDQIRAAETVEALDAIDITIGWPE